MKKMRPRTLSITTSLLCLGLASSLSAEWTLIEDFEDGTFPDGTVITNSDELLFDGEHRITQDLVDPSNSVDRIVADVSSGIRNIGNFLDFSFPLPTPIADGSVATFYHRIFVEGPIDQFDDGPFGFFDTSYGFVDVDYDGSWAYSDFEAQLGYSILTDLNWTVRNPDETGQYAPWTPIWQNVDPFSDLNVWYEIWMVIDHSADTSDIYIKGGKFTEQTKVVDNAKFRNGGSTSPLGYFVMKSHNGNEDTEAGYRGIDPWYLDDLYIDYTGENLSTPSGGQGSTDWNGYAIDENGWANTGDWMGWVNVASDPYIWNLDLSAYIYAGDGSGWIYIFK